MSKTIVQRGLERELGAAEKRLKRAFWRVSKLVEYNGSLQTQAKGYSDPRSVVDEAVTMLREAADYYDAVKEAMEPTGGKDG